MGTTRSIVELRHDTGYGDSLLWHINNALEGKDMLAVSAMEIPKDNMEDRANLPKPTGKFRSLRGLRDELAAKVMPKIKPLVWKRIHRGYQVAECTISVFEVWENGGESGCWIAKCLDKKAVEVATEAEAKAWCQAEYERRVRECLA